MSYLVSTVIAAYNAERTLEEAVDSALAQDLKDHEIVAVNDGSTDSTLAILERYADKIKVIHQPNRGLSAARNAAIARSASKYIALLDSDDQWLPGKLVSVVAELERRPGASLGFSEYGFVDADSVEYGQSRIFGEISSVELLDKVPFPLFSLNQAIMPSTWIVNRSRLEQVGGFCEAFKGSGGFDDYWLLLLLREKGEFVYIPEKLVLYRLLYPSETADKYSAGLAVFAQLVKRRYGRVGEEIALRAKDGYCRSVLSKTAQLMNRGQKLAALRTLLHIAAVRPSYFLGVEFRDRLSLPKNRRRVQALLTPSKPRL